MSPATADRLLASFRRSERHGIATTRAGTLLKQQIPIRTFQQWDDARPGFLQADVVAHCGTDLKGDYVSTLTLTDIATGWTECVPLLYKSQETVLGALQEARTRFPFPILGLDTDNGGEFINETLLGYCEAEQITFTRGRPFLKNDQCYVEQKNGAIVRQVVGYDRFIGVQACQQLGELYRALRLYVNCFQPCMKLQGKQYDGRTLHPIYDRAKTPLQRLLLSGVLPASQEHVWKERSQTLDPVRLFEQVKELQQVLFVHAMGTSSREEKPVAVPLRRFCADTCTAGVPATDVLASEMVCQSHEKADELPSLRSLLEWHRTCHDPFKEVWELIASWVLAHPERTSGTILRELQRLFPDRYQPSHLRTLQRGLRHIRARLRTTLVVQWQKDVVQAEALDLASPEPLSSEQGDGTTDGSGDERALSLPQAPSQLHPPDAQLHHDAIEEALLTQKPTMYGEGLLASLPPKAPSQHHQPLHPLVGGSRPAQRCSSLTIEVAIQQYLEAQRKGRRQPKTLEWHQTALSLLRRYLSGDDQCVLIGQITETHLRTWLDSLQKTPTARGVHRSASTIRSYARSARAFCQWLVRQRYVERTPFAHLTLPEEETTLFRPLNAEEWDSLLKACRPARGQAAKVDAAMERNQALLWMLAETGIGTSEVCRLRVGDVDTEQGRLKVRGKGSRQRWVPLGQESLRHLLSYLDCSRFERATEGKRKRIREEPLFVSETGRPLSENGIALLFGRLRKRAGIRRKAVNPTVLRESFAVQYLQEGGDLFTLRNVLGEEESAVVKRALRIRE